MDPIQWLSKLKGAKVSYQEKVPGFREYIVERGGKATHVIVERGVTGKSKDQIIEVHGTSLKLGETLLLEGVTVGQVSGILGKPSSMNSEMRVYWTSAGNRLILTVKNGRVRRFVVTVS